MNIRIKMDSGKVFEIIPNDEYKTFPQLIDEIFKARYYVLFGANSDAGNVCIDTDKVEYIEVF